MSKPKVILLAGFPNSGTTIASYVLGQHRDVFVAGELAKFPAKQLKAGKICACGRPAMRCDFWMAVMQRLGERATAANGVRLGDLYRAIAAESGAAAIVDVAHDLHAVAEVYGTAEIDLRLVHLRREGLAVLNSRMRRVNLPGRELPPGVTPRLKRIVRHVLRLRAFDHAVGRLHRDLGKQRAVTVHYDTLCSQPEVALSAIGRVADLDLTKVAAQLAAGAAVMVPPHMIRGNPGLKAKQDVYLKRDDGFTTELASSDRFAYAAASGLGSILLAMKGRTFP